MLEQLIMKENCRPYYAELAQKKLSQISLLIFEK